MWKTDAGVLLWIPQSLSPPETDPGVILNKTSRRAINPAALFAFCPYCQLLKFQPFTPRMRVVWEIFSLSLNPPHDPSTHPPRPREWEVGLNSILTTLLPANSSPHTKDLQWRHRWVTSQGQWWFWVDLTAQIYSEVHQTLHNSVPLSPLCRQSCHLNFLQRTA